jgi:CheY-like chemotaxis protein
MQGMLSERPEIRLLTATQGPLGLELARLHSPDIVVLDLHLPGMQGTEVLARLRAEDGTASMPVVVVSADATERQRKKLERLGVWAYLPKPLEIDDFLSVLDEILAQAKPKQRA